MLDERIPLAHGVIGQETQGPGGFFMALRSIHVMQGILDDIAVACPGARIFNYTNPVNIVAQAVDRPLRRADRVAVRGPDHLPRGGGQGGRASTRRCSTSRCVGLNHGSWSVRHTLRRARTSSRCSRTAWARRADDPALTAAGAPDAAPGVGHGRAAERVLPVLLLRGRGPARAVGEADHARARTSSAGCRATGSTTASRPPATRPSSTRRARAAGSTSSSWRSTAWTPSTTTAARRCRSTSPTRARSRASPTRWSSRRSASATPRASGRCRCRACRRTCSGSSRRSRSTSRRRPTRPGRATRATRVRALAAHPLVRSVEKAERLYGGDGRGASRAPARAARAGVAGGRARPHRGEELRPPLRLLRALGQLGGDLVVAAPDVARGGLRLVAARELGDDPAPPGAGVEHLVGPVEVLEVTSSGSPCSAAISTRASCRSRGHQVLLDHPQQQVRLARLEARVERQRPGSRSGSRRTHALALEARPRPSSRGAPRPTAAGSARGGTPERLPDDAAMIGAIHSGTSISRRRL